MFENYSQVYAASITTFAPFIVFILGNLGVPVLESNVVMILSSIVSLIGFIWQLVHRHSEGDVTVAGVRKI